MTEDEWASYERFIDQLGQGMAFSRKYGVAETDIRDHVAEIIAQLCRCFEGRDLERMVTRLQDATGVPRPVPETMHEGSWTVQ